MSGKKWMEGMSHVDPKYIEEAESAAPVKRKQATLWVRWGTLAACLCLVVAASLYWRQTMIPAGTTMGVTQISPQAGGQSELPTGESGGLPTVQGQQLPTMDATMPSFGLNPVLRPGDYEETQLDIMYVSEQVQYVRTNSLGQLGGDISYPIITVISSRQELEAYYNRYKASFRLDSSENTGFWKLCEGYDDAFFAEQDLILALVEEGSGSNRHEVHGLGKAEDGTWQILGLRKIPEAGTMDLAQWHILMPISKNIVTAQDSFSMNLTTVIEDGRS